MTTSRCIRPFSFLGHALVVCAGLELLWVAAQAGFAAAAAFPTPLFEADVLPIFQAHCTRCHGDTPQKAELNLSSQAGAFQGSESGPVIVPGKVDESPLWKVLREGKMPPDKNARLSDAEIATIGRWIESLPAGPARSQPVAQLDQHDIIPIMLRHCTACHNHQRRDGGLDLRTKASMLEGGISGPVLVPAACSRRRVTVSGGDDIGWTWPALPTRKAGTKTATMPGCIATM